MSAIGYPDYQRITQWLGSPLIQNTALVIGAGTHVDGPLEVANFAAIVVALKATGGNVTVTVKQTIQGGPASLILSQQVVVPAGGTLFEAFVLFGTAVEVDLTGSIAGTSVDYALYGSNTTTNAQVITAATINVQHNEVLVAAEATLDFVDAATGAGIWSIVDDAPNTRVKITLPVLGTLAYGTRAAPISTAGTTFGTGVDALAADLSFTADGVSDYVVELSAPYLFNSIAQENLIALKLDGADAGWMGVHDVPAVNTGTPLRTRTILVAPAAGVHTVNARLYVAGGTATVSADVGGAGKMRRIEMSVAKA